MRTTNTYAYAAVPEQDPYTIYVSKMNVYPSARFSDDHNRWPYYLCLCPLFTIKSSHIMHHASCAIGGSKLAIECELESSVNKNTSFVFSQTHRSASPVSATKSVLCAENVSQGNLLFKKDICPGSSSAYHSPVTCHHKNRSRRTCRVQH